MESTVPVCCAHCHTLQYVSHEYVSQQPLRVRMVLPIKCVSCHSLNTLSRVAPSVPADAAIAGIIRASNRPRSGSLNGSTNNDRKRRASSSIHSSSDEDLSSSHGAGYDAEFNEESFSSMLENLSLTSKSETITEMQISEHSLLHQQIIAGHHLNHQSAKFDISFSSSSGHLPVNKEETSSFNDGDMSYIEMHDISVNLTIDDSYSSLLDKNNIRALTLNEDWVEMANKNIDMFIAAIRSKTTVTSVKIDGRFLEGLSEINQKQIFDAVGGLSSLKCLDVVGVNDDWLTLPVPALTSALSKAVGLQELSLKNYELTGSEYEFTHGFIAALRGLQFLTNFKLVDLIPPNPRNLDQVVQCLSYLTNLQYIHIDYTDHLQTAEANPQAISVEAVGRLSRNAEFFGKLKKLVMTNIQIGHEHVKKFAEGLLDETSTLKFVDLSYNVLGDLAGAALATALRTNKSLEILRLEGVSLGRAVGHKIAEALQVNNVLKEISLKNNDLDDDCIIAIAEALKTNSTIKKLCISGSWVHRLGDRATAALLEMLKENYTLEKLDIDAFGDVQLNIQTYLKLNKAGRQQLLRSNHALRNSPSTDAKMWVDALVKTQDNLSCFYHLMRANPSLVEA